MGRYTVTYTTRYGRRAVLYNLSAEAVQVVRDRQAFWGGTDLTVKLQHQWIPLEGRTDVGRLF